MFVNVVKPKSTYDLGRFGGGLWVFMAPSWWFWDGLFWFTTLTTTNFPVDLIFPQFDSSFIGPCVDIRRVGFLAACFGMGLPSGLMVGEDLCGEDVNLLWLHSLREPHTYIYIYAWIIYATINILISYIYIYVYIYMYIYMYIYVYIYMYICENTHTYVCINK